MEERRIIKNPKNEGVHNVIMEGRKKLSVSGVCEVESFNEEEIVLHTNMGILIVEGEMLHISKLSIDSGEVMIDGSLETVRYADEKENIKGGFFGRLFK